MESSKLLKIKTSIEKNSHLLFVAITSVALKLFYWFSTSTLDSYEDDAICRTFSAFSSENWFEPYGTWPFYHKALIKLIYLITGEVEEAGRLLSFLLSLPLQIFYYLITLKLFGRKIAFWSFAILSYSPVVTIFSTVSMSEIPCLLFILGGMYFYYIGFQSNKKNYFLFSSLFFMQAGYIRYESWLVALIFFYFYMKREDTSLGRSFLFLPSLLPIITTFLSSKNLIFNALSANYKDTKLEDDYNLKIDVFSTFFDVFGSASIMIFLTSLIGLYFFWIAKKDQHKEYLITFLSLFVFIFLGQVLGAFAPFPRYYIVVYVFSIPLFMKAFLEIKLSKSFLKVVYSLIVAFILVSFIKTIYFHGVELEKSVRKENLDLNRAISHLKSGLSPKSRVFVASKKYCAILLNLKRFGTDNNKYLPYHLEELEGLFSPDWLISQIEKGKYDVSILSREYFRNYMSIDTFFKKLQTKGLNYKTTYNGKKVLVINYEFEDE